VPHPFEEELGWLVRTNHTLVLESISSIEREEIALENLDPTEIHTYSDELRRAANNLALVGLVTRLHHWVSVFVEELPKHNTREKSAKEIGLVKNLTTLNAALARTESSPISIDFFENLVTVRDAIIHADSKSKWTYGKKERQVSERYAITASGEVDFTETHLQEAIENSVRQVKWYDDRLDALQEQG
jgi:hypothetical protein